MKKQILSILLCLCMALSLLPMSALAAEYDDWAAATAEGVTLKADTDKVTIGGTAYTYKGDASVSGIEMYTGDPNATALTEACCWKAGGGYVLYNPTVVSGETKSAEVTLHNAEISVSGAKALSLPYSNFSGDYFPVDVTVKVEGANSLTTDGANNYPLYHHKGDTIFMGDGTLSLTNSAADAKYNLQNLDGAVTIDSGAQITVSCGEGGIGGNLTVTGSGSKLTIGSGTTLGISSPTATVTVENGGVLENNGTLDMSNKTKDDPGITGEISGNGAFQFDGSSQLYCRVNGVFYPYGGDISTSGLNLSGKNNDGTENSAYNAPAVTTRYKAGSGYICYTPADGGANAKLELHDATINTTSGRALFLPAAPVDITVTGDNSLTANGSYNFAIDPNGQAVSISGDGSLSLTGSKGIASLVSVPSVTVDIGGNLGICTTQTYSISANGNVDLSAANITTGIVAAGSGAFSATAKTGNLTIGDSASNSQAVYAGNITLKAPNGAISVMGKAILLDTSGMVTANAKCDITFNSTNTSSKAISFGTGVSITSNAGSIDVTTSGYSGIEKTEFGTGGGGVELRAAKDITLNADTTAISTSGEDVKVIAGGKLSSTSKYGFQVRELTIKANEVSVAGTEQDGIYATSVSITNPTGGNCKRVSITATSNDASRAAIHALGNATTGNITVKADDLFLCGNDSAKAISAKGTVTIEGAGVIAGAISAGTDKIATGIARASKSGGKLSDKLDLKINTPTETTFYEILNGSYIIFTPAHGGTNAVLTLHNVNNAGYLQGGIILPDEPVTLKLEGVNVFFEITATNNIAVSGNGLLDSEIKNSNDSAILTVGNGATLNAVYIATEDNITIYGSYYYGGTITPTTKLKLNTGAVLKLEYGRYLEFEEGASLDNLTIGAGATIVNDTYVTLPKDTPVEQIKALPLSGTGVVRVAKTYDSKGLAETWDTYTNDGVKVNEITGGLDLTDGSHSGKSVENNGYSWDATSGTLTLGNNAYVSGNLTLPEHATINTTADSTINGSISPASSGACNLTFSGAGSLNVSGDIGNSQGGIMTVSGGAHVSVNGSVNIGTSGGAGGTLNVTGAGTTLNVSSSSGGYAIFLETVNIASGASVMATAEGESSIGVEALSGGVHVTGGSTLTTGCAYGVYIEGGKLEVDSTSKLITNGTVAPFCIVGASNSKEGAVLSLPGTPDGTEIASKSAENTNGTHIYWSLVQKGDNLSVSDTNTTPVTLTGAKTGTLTFVKASSGENNNNNGGNNNSTGGGSGGGSSSVSYTLNFETNGGSKISSISKESGSTLDLVSYKPTREGYDFSGWYADQALSEKVTSLKLTKNTTIYAKWTEKPEKATNPFADVAENTYYHDAVLWAVQKNVTSGTSNTAFSPDMICTRAQMVTFLWRAMGSPEPTLANCPFTDVAKDAYYDKAVLWAVEKGITAGITETSFSPDATVNRGQSVTFLWRAAGRPAVTLANPFTDVSKDAYYYNAMLWAVEKGITQGTSTTTFSPSASCTRSQIVTFLYRYTGK